jgi:hypothetical protein
VQNDSSVAFEAGWYPDPTGAHELRYHNGQSWTGDVSTDGIRHVSPLPVASGTEPSGTEPSGTTSLVLGIISLCLGWIPFVSVVAFGTAVIAIVIGVRRRRSPRTRAASNMGIVTGAVGLVFSIGGTWLAFVILDAVARFEDPGPHDIELVSCAEVDAVTRAEGMITNLDDGTRSYTIEVTFDGERSESVEIDDVAPGDTVSFVVERDFRFEDLDCEVTAVNGPRPFGLET